MRRVVFSSSGDLTRSHGDQEGNLRSLVITAAESLFATLFPSDCRFCGAPLLHISRLPVCEICLEKMQRLSIPVCAICGERLPVRYQLDTVDHEPRCGMCLRAAPPYDKAAAYGSFDAGLQDLVHLLKYQHVKPAANLLGRMMAEVLSDLAPHFTASEILVIPVPLHSSKLRQRGFNQSELLAKAALKHKASLTRFQLSTHLMERQRATASQTGLTRHQRRENIRGAFRVIQPNRVAGREVLLVDDVFTTGTTLSECARVLRRAGAAKILAATVARVLKPEATFASVAEDSGRETPAVMAAHA